MKNTRKSRYIPRYLQKKNAPQSPGHIFIHGAEFFGPSKRSLHSVKRFASIREKDCFYP